MTNADAGHISEKALTLSVLAPESLDPAEHEYIREHLGGCELCRERLAVIEAFHRDFMKGLEEGPGEWDRAVARRLASEPRARWLALPEHAFTGRWGSLVKSHRTFIEVVDPLRNGVIRWVLGHVRHHPVRMLAGGMACVAALLAISVFVIRGRSDTNPVRFIVKDRVLSVMNKEGRVLWTRHVPGVRDGADEEFNSPSQPDNRFVGIGDIDGKGTNVVLVCATSSLAQDTLYCIEGDGTLRWSAWAGNPIRFGAHAFTAHAQMGFYGFQVAKGAQGGAPVLYAIARSTQYYPSKLMRLDTRTGRELERYWHPGAIEKLMMMDVTSEPGEEILVGGFNELYGMAFVALLDQASVRGCGPVPEDAQPDGVASGMEKYYLLFPPTDLGRILNPVPFNSVRGIYPGARPYFQVYVDESIRETTNATPTLVYTLDSTMRIVTVVTGNTFEKLYDDFFHQGKLTRPRDKAYKEALVHAVLYWDGERFVRHHAMKSRSAGNAVIRE